MAATDALCLDVRQHIIGFLGVDLQRHMLQSELSADENGGGLVAGAPNCCSGWGRRMRGTETAKREAQILFPWLSHSEPFANPGLMRNDFLTVQLISSTWYHAFHTAVLEADHIIIYRALLLWFRIKAMRDQAGRLREGTESQRLSRRAPTGCFEYDSLNHLLGQVPAVAQDLGSLVTRTQETRDELEHDEANAVAVKISAFQQATITMLREDDGDLRQDIRELMAYGNPPHRIRTTLPYVCAVFTPDLRAGLTFGDCRKCLSMNFLERLVAVSGPHGPLSNRRKRNKLQRLGKQCRAQNGEITPSEVVHRGCLVLYQWFLELVAVNNQLIELLHRSASSPLTSQERKVATTVREGEDGIQLHSPAKEIRSPEEDATDSLVSIAKFSTIAAYHNELHCLFTSSVGFSDKTLGASLVETAEDALRSSNAAEEDETFLAILSAAEPKTESEEEKGSQCLKEQ